MGKDPSEIRHAIALTRVRMGETLEALSYKANLPARARETIDARVATLRARIATATKALRHEAVPRARVIATEKPFGVALGAAAVGFLAGIVLPVKEHEPEHEDEPEVIPAA
jgi:ElaB/YqjD/DUF883 family membrane-anchored ribosome-binding protein